ncbi:MBL fold metallo-hydrolase [Novimethylophilus kurashikiensis]|uniref:MBL fold metallo-hydrolase n=1 Tax=Novimethylophilus kurashikiensis TaxID=1825523 RepID=A0A2R5FB44_9PROT|nr:MBL fold metallo-hydrolase [Novimethylophilus kurashikiensis]GBG14123.1 MBL fold metallo-hydrolase [Novimethylophilus kurashikiensis]
MRFALLGSGSAGNSLVVQEGHTTLLLDCGFSLRETILRLARLGLEPEQVSGLLLTHEHVDHSRGAYRFSGHFKAPLYITHGTRVMLEPPPDHLDLRIIDVHDTFTVQDIEVHPYPVPHDAREPAQYVFSNGQSRLGVLTDTGNSTPHIESMLTGCHALVLECNHDIDMLMTNPRYPYPLKQRIRGDYGHLDNMTSKALLSRLDNSSLRHIVAAHLSEKNNRPELARAALSEALNCSEDWINVATQTEGTGWLDLE